MMSLSIENTELAKFLGTLAPRVEEHQHASIIKRAMEGEDAAFGVLVEEYREKIYRLLFFMLHHQEDALDLVQETFIKAYKSIGRLRSADAFYSWLTRIAINLAINSIKKKQRLRKCQEKLAREQSPRVENPMEIVERRELQESLVELIASLPAKQKAALVLCDIEGYSYREIAEILNCRIGTVMSRIYYAREYIRGRLQSRQ